MTSLTENEATRPGGINATGVGRIASKASISKPTLYHHVPSNAAVVEKASASSAKKAMRLCGHRRGSRAQHQVRSCSPYSTSRMAAALYEGASALSTSLNDPAPWARARAAAEASFRCGCR